MCMRKAGASSSSPAVYRGMEVVLVGLSGSLQPVSRKCHVTNCHAVAAIHRSRFLLASAR